MPLGPLDTRNMFLFAASMNPLFAWSGLVHAMTPKTRPVYAGQPALQGTPIDIEARASDPGIRIAVVDKDTVRLSGTAKGDKVMRDVMGLPVGGLARGVSLGLDIDQAPTETVFGRTDYTEKNSRHFGVITRVGQSAHALAEALADKVNDHHAFSAKVIKHRDGSASVTLSRR